MSECKHGVPLFGFCQECSRDIADKESSASPAGYVATNAEHACLEIYLSISVNQLNTLPDYIQEAWNVGQSIYAAERYGNEATKSITRPA